MRKFEVFAAVSAQHELGTGLSHIKDRLIRLAYSPVLFFDDVSDLTQHRHLASYQMIGTLTGQNCLYAPSYE